LAGLDGRLTTEQLEANKQEDLSLYVERLGDLDPTMSAVKIGKKLKELGLRDENGKPVHESGITIFYHGFWTSFWHIEKCRKALGIDQASAPAPSAPEPAPEPDPTPTAAPIEYIPDFIANPDAIYAALLSLPWQRHQASFGQPVPRDEVWVAPYPYKYSSRIYPACDGWTPELLSIKDAVEKHTGVKYDSVLCNLYRTGKDYVPYHCDCEDEMSPAHPIASVSFGAVRVFEMLLKSNRQIGEKMQLANGSLLIMKAGMQQEWMHSIRKTRREVGARINLTFRVMTKTEGVA
jgi:alkylated DNA repair dioxygenase AlkB